MVVPAAIRTAARIRRPDSGRMEVLLVEDEVLISMTLAEELADAGFDVTEASTAEAAMAALAATAEAALPPPILVTDMNLGGDMDGLALVAELRRRWPEAGAVVTTTRYPPDLDMRRRDPREVWLVKPFGPLRLTATVHQLMDRSRH